MVNKQVCDNPESSYYKHALDNPEFVKGNKANINGWMYIASLVLLDN